MAETTMTEESAHRKTLTEIADGLRRWYRGEADRRLTIRLTAVAVETVLQSYGLRRRICAAAAAGGTTPARIALSLLAELFIGTGSESRLGFSLGDAIDHDDAVLFSVFKQIVRNTGRQELFHRWPENDPLAARLWRRLHRVIRDDDRIMSFPSDHPEWIAAVSVEPSFNLDRLEEIELRQVVCEVFRPALKTADLVAAIVAHPACHNKVIAIDVLFGMLRECVPQGLAGALEEELSSPSLNPEYALAVEKAVAAIRPAISAAIEHYVAKGRLSPDMARGFHAALLDLAVDWGDGAPAVGYYEYLHAHCPALVYEVYRETYRAIFEYLAEKVTGWFFDQMRGYFL